MIENFSWAQQYPDIQVEIIDTPFQDEVVLKAFQESDWFTPKYIAEILKNEPYPERASLLEPFTNPALADFKLIGFKLTLTKKDCLYLNTLAFVNERMVGPQSHPFRLDGIPFADQEIMELANEFGMNEKFEFYRQMVNQVNSMLLCLIAPKDIRREIVRIGLMGKEEIGKQALIWSQLVKKGVQAYLSEHNIL